MCMYLSVFWLTTKHRHVIRSDLFLCAFDVFDYSCVGEPHCLCLVVCLSASRHACLPVCVCDSPVWLFLFSICSSLGFSVPCIYQHWVIHLRVMYLLLANQSNQDGDDQRCCWLVKGSSVWTHRTSLKAHADTAYAEKYFTYWQTLKICGPHFPMCMCVHRRLPASTCVPTWMQVWACICAYISSCKNAHSNLSVKPGQPDAELKTNPLIIAHRLDQMFAHAACIWQQLSSAHLQIHCFMLWFRENACLEMTEMWNKSWE